MPAWRSIDGETSLAQFVCLSVSLPLLAPSTHPLQKLLCGGEERRRPNCVFRFTLADVQRPAGGEGGLGRQKRRQIKTKWNVLLSPGYPFYSYHNDNPPLVGRLGHTFYYDCQSFIDCALKFFVFLLSFLRAKISVKILVNCSLFLQVDLRHIDEDLGRPEVEIGVDLTEFYMSVEWDILEVPAIRNVKYVRQFLKLFPEHFPLWGCVLRCVRKLRSYDATYI